MEVGNASAQHIGIRHFTISNFIFRICNSGKWEIADYLRFQTSDLLLFPEHLDDQRFSVLTSPLLPDLCKNSKGKFGICIVGRINLGKQEHQIMASRKRKSKKQQRIEARDEQANRRFFLILIGLTVLLLVMMYFIYQGF